MDDLPHVIIAEDDTFIAMALEDYLTDSGFRVTVTHNGRDALEAETSDAAALLLTDMRMPVMDGGELIRQARQRRPDLPIVVITGYSEHVPRSEPGRLAILKKPFDAPALLQAIQALLMRP